MTDTMTPRRTRPRGFAPWTPRPETLSLLAAIRTVLDDYRDHLPLTCRQVFYRLVGASGFDKTEAAYCPALRDRGAGTAGRAPALRRDPRRRGEPLPGPRLGGPGRLPARGGRRCPPLPARPAGAAAVRLWLLCEAAGMAPMLARVALARGVPVLSSGGFDSLTAKHDLACELAAEGPAEVLHVGDHDPSGVHLFAALAEDVGAMAEALGASHPAFSRLAVTGAQAEALALPTAPAKATDRRAFAGETVQAEAIPPDVLTRLVADAIDERQDARTFAETLAAEDADREMLLAHLEGLA